MSSSRTANYSVFSPFAKYLNTMTTACFYSSIIDTYTGAAFWVAPLLRVSDHFSYPLLTFGSFSSLYFLLYLIHYYLNFFTWFLFIFIFIILWQKSMPSSYSSWNWARILNFTIRASGISWCWHSPKGIILHSERKIYFSFQVSQSLPCPDQFTLYYNKFITKPRKCLAPSVDSFKIVEIVSENGFIKSFQNSLSVLIQYATMPKVYRSQCYSNSQENS